MGRCSAIVRVGITGAGIAGASLLYLLDPAASTWFPPCPVHAAFGLHCPGCGALRAIHHALHGRIWAAFLMNPVALSLAPVLLVAVFLPRSGRWSSLAMHHARHSRVMLLLALLITYGVARNLPFEPFCWLAPRTS